MDRAELAIAKRIIERKMINITRLFFGGKAAIKVPPKRAPKPSREVNKPISKDSILNFSISRRLINAMKGNEKILNIKVSKITMRRLIFFLVSDIISLKEFKKGPLGLFVINPSL